MMLKTIVLAVMMALSGCGTTGQQVMQTGLPELQIILTAARDSYVAQCKNDPSTDHCKALATALQVAVERYNEFNGTEGQ